MFTKLHDRRIPNVGIGVGTVEFKLPLLLKERPCKAKLRTCMHDTLRYLMPLS